MYTIFDAHCDTISECFIKNENLRKNNLNIDCERIINSGYNYGQIFAAFVDRFNINTSPMKYVMGLIKKYHNQIEINYDIMSHCTAAEDIKNSFSHNKIAALLSIEGGEALEGDINALWVFYQLGVRILTLTWNYANEICDGITESRGGGLTDFGKNVIREMNRLGMIIDVSHLSERGFWDVIELSKAPIIASHSNAKAICGHIRNLNDKQIKAVINKKGFIGINFYSRFLLDDGKCTSDDIIKHMDYILELGGEDVLGFGSDFDGVDELPEDIKGIEDIYTIINKMLQKGYSDELINKITCHNFLRVAEEIL